jgi:predicted methyltransferase
MVYPLSWGVYPRPNNKQEMTMELTKIAKPFSALLLSAALGLNTAAVAADTHSADFLQKALNSELRDDKDKSRDANRKPADTLTFFELKADDTVIELFPGGGWYTKILGKALDEKGKLYVSLGLGYLKDNLEKWQLNKVDKLATDTKITPTAQRGVFDIEAVDFGVEGVDTVLTFRNAHNLTPAARAKLNAAVFKALKPGGIYGVIDHSRRHMEPTSDANWRRADPVAVIKEALDAGFELEAWSDMHRQPGDSLKVDTVHESVNRNSDRFTLKFRKPK